MSQQDGSTCSIRFAQNDPTDPGGTFRPNLPPATTRGEEFKPLRMERREPVVKDLPDSPLGIFQAFLPVFVVEEWAESTNAHVQTLITSENATPDRLRHWMPLTVAEVYTFVGIVICMQNATEKSMTDYWRTYEADGIDATYPWTEHMSLHRFQALWRYIRLCDYSDFNTAAAPERAYGRVEKWSRHIQETTTSFYVPGSSVAVDECIQGFQGKSGLKTHIPNKPTPDGIKIWAIGEGGILMRWLWHVPGSGPVGIADIDSDEEEPDKETHLTPTQRVVLALLFSLPAATYHIYLDNLFSSPALFKRLYEAGHAASGTCRANCGIHKDLVALKKKPGSTPYHATMEIPTPCGRVNQITWRDNEMVLFLTTTYSTSETIVTLRRRPKAGNTPHKRLARAAFGEAAAKEFEIPKCINDYNHLMGAIDIADQLRAEYPWHFRWRRGPTPPLTWGFLLGTVMANAYRLDSGWGTWKTSRRDHLAWRKALVQQLFSNFSPFHEFRRRARPGYFTDRRNHQVDMSLHVKGNRGKRSVCVVCRALYLKAKNDSKRRPFAPIDTNAANGAAIAKNPACKKKSGCLTCDVALCTSGLCWDIFHRSAIGVK